MISQEGWSEEKLYSYKPGYYVLMIRAEFPWKEEFRKELERYALKLISEERKRYPQWKHPSKFTFSGNFFRAITHILFSPI